jgi:hypothetical protein
LAIRKVPSESELQCVDTPVLTEPTLGNGSAVRRKRFIQVFAALRRTLTKGLGPMQVFTAAFLLSLFMLAGCGSDEAEMSRKHEVASQKEMRVLIESPEYVRAVGEAQARVESDNSVVEMAPWFGTTGLSNETERELSRYLRREFGESLDEPNSLKAADLVYLGVFSEREGIVYYWQVPYGGEPVFAYVIESGANSHMGWGARKPPTK